MATTLYLKSSRPLFADASASAWGMSFRDSSRNLTVGSDTVGSIWQMGTAAGPYALSETIGTGTGTTLTKSTSLGPTNGLVYDTATFAMAWVSPPLAASATISSTVSVRVCGLESSMNANATFRAWLYRVDGVDGTWTEIGQGASAVELGTGLAARDFTFTPTSTTCDKGDCLAVMVGLDDGGGTLASGHTVTLYWDGSNANTADSYVQTTENLTFTTSAPSGSSYYLRDTASSVNPGAATEKEMATAQGSGTSTAVYTTVNGPLTYPGNQWTVSGGGAAVEWYTPQLEAFTLAGVVQVDLGNGGRLEDAFANHGFGSLVVELASCNNDGSNVTIWARSLFSVYVSALRVVPYSLFGPDLSVTAGQRLRLRLYQDDERYNGQDQRSTYTCTLRYDGADTYASRIILTQSVTQYTPSTPLAPPFTRRDLRIVPLI